MTKIYKNELLGLKHKRACRSVEAYYAVDCGTYWEVWSASDVRRKYGSFRVKKTINEGGI